LRYSAIAAVLCAKTSRQSLCSPWLRAQLIAAVYGDDHHISARTIDTHVRNLRAKLAAAGAPIIETVHGVGYRCS